MSSDVQNLKDLTEIAGREPQTAPDTYIHGIIVSAAKRIGSLEAEIENARSHLARVWRHKDLGLVDLARLVSENVHAIATSCDPANEKRSLLETQENVAALAAKVTELEGEVRPWREWERDARGSRAGKECPSGESHAADAKCLHCDMRDLIHDYRERAEQAEASLKEWQVLLEEMWSLLNMRLGYEDQQRRIRAALDKTKTAGGPDEP